MKIETLKKYFMHNERAKIYLTSDKYLLAGYASHPREDGSAVMLDIGPYVVYSKEREETIYAERTFSLKVSDGDKITRRFQTHKRHSGNLPHDYVKRACEL